MLIIRFSIDVRRTAMTRSPLTFAPPWHTSLITNYPITEIDSMLFYRVNWRSRLYTDIYKVSHISISSHHQSTLNSLLSTQTLSTTYLSTMCTTNIRVYNCGKYTQSTSHCRKAVWNPITKRMNACGDPRQTVSSTTGTYCNSSKCTQQPGFYRSPSHK